MSDPLEGIAIQDDQSSMTTDTDHNKLRSNLRRKLREKPLRLLECPGNFLVAVLCFICLHRLGFCLRQYSMHLFKQHTNGNDVIEMWAMSRADGTAATVNIEIQWLEMYLFQA